MEPIDKWLTRPDGLATSLRTIRQAAGLTGQQLSTAAGWAASKTSRIEAGKQLPTARDVEAWATVCGLDADQLQDLLLGQQRARVMTVRFRDWVRHGQAAVQDRHAEVAANARLCRDFELAFVPGLLQIPDYARVVLTESAALHEAPVDDVDAAVKSRMQRQQLLYDPQREFHFLLAEPVLRWLRCPPAVMRAQLDRLQTVIGVDRIRFGIYPMGRPIRWFPQNAFHVFDGEEMLVEVETMIGQTWYRDEDAYRYSRVLDLLWEDAVTGDAARELIVAATRALPA